MIETLPEERRTCVRGDLFFRVKYKVITAEEYEQIRKTDGPSWSLVDHLGLDPDDSDKFDKDTLPNTYLVDFLIQMDEKLDRLLTLFANKEAREVLLAQGIGLNISGSGISIRVDEPVEPGMIVHSTFVLSKAPMVFIKVFGEIERVTPITESGRTYYELGIQFLDLNPNDRERIIACVFQKQREALRGRNKENYESGGV